MSVEFKPRPYQIDALNKIESGLKSSLDPFLMQGITGCGKTVIFVRFINKHFKNSDKTFLILMHKQELVKQFYETFKEMSDIPIDNIGIACSSLNSKKTNKRITIATVQTFSNQVDKYNYCDLLIIDEAHKIEIGKNSQYDVIINKLYEKNAKLRIIGCTSTPFRLGHGMIYGKYCSGKNLFPKCNHKVSYNELKESGYLMPLEGKVAVGETFHADIKDVNTSGDYVLDQLGDLMTKQVHLQTAVDAVEKYCKDFNHICVFCCTIEHAKQVCELLGDECTIVHSKLSKSEREDNMDAWKSGKKRIITSVNILVEGFDFPALDCLVMARPTLSAALYLQAVGRVLRISDGKERAFLLDLTENTDKFGTDLDNVEVTIPKKVGDLIKEERKYEKECPQCLAICHIVCLECPECEYEWPAQEYEEAVNIPELKTVTFAPDPIPEPVEWGVEWMEYHRHKKEGKPDSVRIEYHTSGTRFGTRIASEWLCFEHGGYATQQAHKWWMKMHTKSIPANTSDALTTLYEGVGLAQPVAILLQKEGKYNRVVNHLFGSEGSEKIVIDDSDIPF